MNFRMRRRDLTTANKLARFAWNIVWATLFWPSPIVLHGWRRFLLRVFGARIAAGAHVYPSVRIWAPWNLEMKEGACLGHYVDCYCVDRIVLGRRALVSQYAYLCTASHDYEDLRLPLVTGPIAIGDHAWVTAGVLVGPGVSVGEGAVALARSAVVRDVEPWAVVGGVPARFVKQRRVRPA
jgi:putative colanic acid biosynthesis acetyltransferase WcaF